MPTPCNIVFRGKNRAGYGRYWCIEHKANAAGPKGTQLSACLAAADPPIPDDLVLHLDPSQYPGGIAIWGAVPPIYDTTTFGDDFGLHVHARVAANVSAKAIDKTYKKVSVTLQSDLLRSDTEILAEAAIYYMTSLVMQKPMKVAICTHCKHSHLDKDWFSVHPHQKHLCAGCGRNFRDNVRGIGNPIMALKEIVGDTAIQRETVPAKKKLRIQQKDYPGGIRIWGSNQAVIWTASRHEESGIHVHAYETSDEDRPAVDDTFCSVEIDGVTLDETQVRTYMAQLALPHLAGSLVALSCSHCGKAHFDDSDDAFTPRIERVCLHCSKSFQAKGRKKKVVSNPMIAICENLQRSAPRARRESRLNLRPEI